MKSSRTILAAAAILALGVAAASGAVLEPPAAPHSIIAFPERDFVSATGYTDQIDKNVTVNVFRNGIIIGTAQHSVAAPDGLVEINHPGGGCWVGTTPDILPGDQVRITPASGDADQTTVANVTAQPAVDVGTGVVKVRGTATDAAGNQIPIGQLSQRLISAALVPLVGRRRLDAPGDGSLAYDAPGSTHWTATYTLPNQAVVDAAVAAETRILWLGADPLAGTELTIYEAGLTGGPAPPCTAPAATNAVTDFGRTMINLENLGTSLTVSGLAQFDATNVSVALSNGATSTAPVAVPLPGSAVGQTWSAVFSPAQVMGLGDGMVTATATYTVGLTPINGVNKSIWKDTIAPPAPTATPGAGSYTQAQSVTLTHADGDPATTIRFTNDGSEPGPASLLFSAPFLVTAPQTIQAVSIDLAGNRSTVARFAIRIGVAQFAIRIGPKRLTLRLASITNAKKELGLSLSQVRKKGLILTGEFGVDTRTVRMIIFRRAGKSHRRVMLANQFVTPTPAPGGLHRVVLKSSALSKKLSRGLFFVELTPGESTETLGTPVTISFRIGRR